MSAEQDISRFDSLTSAVSEHGKALYLAAFRNLMLPMVRNAMRYGLAYPELLEAVKRAVAECAMDQHAQTHPNEEISASQLAIRTGLPRQDASRVRITLAEGAAEELSNLNRIGRLIVGWQRDFVGPYGLPLELPLEPGERSFPDLVRRYVVHASPAEMLEDLRNVGVIEVTAEGKARLTNRSYITGRLRPESIERMSWVVHDLADTVDFNLDPARDGPPRFERRVYTPEPISGDLLAGFRQLVEDEGPAFLEKLDNWLTEQFQELRKKRRQAKAEPATPNPDARYVGVGIYWFERDTFGA